MNVFMKSIFASFSKTLKNQSEINKLSNTHEDIWRCGVAFINTTQHHSAKPELKLKF